MAHRRQFSNVKRLLRLLSHSSLVTYWSRQSPAAAVRRWITGFKRAVSSVVEHLVYTEEVGGSKPSPPSLRSQRSGERRLSRRSFSEGGPFSPFNVQRSTSNLQRPMKRALHWTLSVGRAALIKRTSLRRAICNSPVDLGADATFSNGIYSLTSEIFSRVRHVSGGRFKHAGP